MTKIKYSATSYAARTLPISRTVSSMPPPGGRAARAPSGKVISSPAAHPADKSPGGKSSPKVSSVNDDDSCENSAGDISEARVRTCTEDYRLSRARDGMNGADRAFFEPLIRQWNEILHPGKDQQDTGYKALPRCEFLMRVAVGMHESMGLRDSLILSVISQLTPSELIEAAVNPTQPDTAQLVSSTLSAVFRDSTQRPDQEVCGRCLDTLVEIHSRVPRTYCVQPLAVMAYLLWWSGRDEEAGGAALRALSIDGECTLASIVLTATEYGISPAWKGRGKK